MRKRIFTVLLLVCVLAAAGCNLNTAGQENGEETDGTELMISTEAQMARAGGADLETETEASERIVYAGVNYTWQEITIVIPQEWDGKYVLKEETNGFSLYQMSSNEIDEALGFLCGVYKSDQYTNAGMGETLVAYTDAGEFYYLIQPTDMNCYMEDEAVVTEYTDMMEKVEWISASMQIAAENVHYDANQYEIPVSSIFLLNEQHLVNLSDNELWIARNEIYARHGKEFKHEYLASYFQSCSWYEAKEGKTEVSERELNEVEISNLQLIVAAEEAYVAAHSYPKQYAVGDGAEEALSGGDRMQTIRYEVIAGENQEYTGILTIDDVKYNLDNYVTLISPVQDVFYVTDIAEFEEGLEIAVLDEGASADPVTHFFKYDGNLRYIGAVNGFPFENYDNNGMNGFNNQSGITGTGRTDLIETAYVDAYYRYDMDEGMITQTDMGMYHYKWYTAHELFVNLPLYVSRDAGSPTLILEAQEEVYFIRTDCREWIQVRGKDGTEGYIQVQDGMVSNVGLPTEEVFSDLYFFD